MRNLPLTLLLFLLLPLAAQAQNMVANSQLTLLVDKGTTLNSDRKEKLSLIDHGRAVSGCISIYKDTLVKVVSQQQFEMRETVSTTNNSTPKRNYTVAYVQVLNGDQQGKAGWVVVSSGGGGSTLSPPPAGYQGPASSTAKPASGSDLGVSVSRGDREMQVAGKEIFSVSVSNKGDTPVKASFTVTVEVDGKVVKTERVRGLAAFGSYYFNAEISESAVRKGATLVVKVDAQNAVQELNESDNVYTQKL